MWELFGGGEKYPKPLKGLCYVLYFKRLQAGGRRIFQDAFGLK
jgi:hypothetical protein